MSTYLLVIGSTSTTPQKFNRYEKYFVFRAFTQAVVEKISGHYETGEKLPASALNSLDRVRRHMAGFHLCNEIYRCRLDLEIFST